ncbi:hypothetical protein HMPREF7215_2144 [Pyramidobacter piscolens W5455]|uniref:Uncharacterized protein n=1 Tax=Pyramidobacter piscolens W5455 TaxID=352165 RepID=A0ABM9ZUJ1_9BACT|nr:hypothetical protein HMPREF7215_2144 [Pyramidobacter piscolens W5455]
MFHVEQRKRAEADESDFIGFRPLFACYASVTFSLNQRYTAL